MLAPLVLALAVAQAPVPGLPPGQQPSAPAKTAPAEKPWPPAGVLRKGPDIVSPRLIKGPHPRYTAEAMKAGIQGSVGLELVVKADGSVGDVRVTRSLDNEFGLDNEAVRAVKTWQFAPGTKDGVSVPVLVEVEMTFSVR